MTASASEVPWSPIVVGGSAAVALALVVLRWVIWAPDDATRPSLEQRVGPANWAFGDSWASTLTIFGAFLAAVLYAQVLPPEGGRHLTTRDLALLTLFFGFVVVLAPFFYNATASRADVPAGEPAASEGRVGTFLVASAITIWAAFGQLATLGFIAAELTGESAVFYVFVAVLIVVGALMARYSWASIRWVLEAQVHHQQRMALAGAQPEPRPSWTLL